MSTQTGRCCRPAGCRAVPTAARLVRQTPAPLPCEVLAESRQKPSHRRHPGRPGSTTAAAILSGSAVRSGPADVAGCCASGGSWDSCSNWCTVRVETPAKSDRLAAARVRQCAAMAKDRSPGTPTRGGSLLHPPDDIFRVDPDVASIGRVYPRLPDASRPTNDADCSAAHSSDPSARWLLLLDNGSTICKTILDYGPIVDRSNSQFAPPVSNGSLFVANSVRETSQHLPKDQLCLSEDTVSDLVAVIVFICQQSYGAYVSALTWRLANTAYYLLIQIMPIRQSTT